MRQCDRILLVSVIAVLAVAAWGQAASQHLLTRDEIKKVMPSEFFYDGQKAPTQLRNAVGFQLQNGKLILAALVDASGYSTAVQQKYQGMLICEAKLRIGGTELSPGEYGFGFTKEGKFVVMNVANEDALIVPYETDAKLQRPVPLKMIEDGPGYKLYAGRRWVEIKPE